MKLVQVVPVRIGRPSLGTLLEDTERRLRGTSTTFIRRRKRRWVHTKYPGWITWETSKSGLLVAEIRSHKHDSEWQLLQAFIGYLNRHLGKDVDSITILYYPE